MRGAEHLDDLGVHAQAGVGQRQAFRAHTQRQASPGWGATQLRLHRRVGDEVHGRVANEAAHKLVGRLVVDSRRHIVLRDLAAVHHGDAVAQAHGFSLIMRDIQRGGLDVAQQTLELTAHFQAQQRIQVAQWFVHQQHIGLHGQCAGHRHALALAA